MDEAHTMTHDQMDLKLEVKAGPEPGTFEGYGAVFGNRDRDGDIVAKGAFAESLQGRVPAMLWQHNQKEPIGRFDSVIEDEKGLRVKGKLSLKGRGAEAYELLQMGALDGLSIGFVTKEASRDATSGTRTIHKAELMEISLVTFPANEMARIDAVKTADTIADERTFERFLRDNGFSRSRAKAITSKGFKSRETSKLAVNGDDYDFSKIIEDLNAKSLALKSRLPLEEKGPSSRTIIVKKGRQTEWYSFEPKGQQLAEANYVYIIIRSLKRSRAPKVRYKVLYQHPKTGSLTGTSNGSWETETVNQIRVAGKAKRGIINRLFGDPISIKFDGLEDDTLSVAVRWNR